MAETYYIYEIPGVKVGITDNLKRRQLEQRKKGKMVVLESYIDIIKASERERELQAEKGYRVDKVPYYKQLDIIKLTKTPEALKKRNGSYTYPEESRILKGKPIKQLDKKGNLIKIHSTLHNAAVSVQDEFSSFHSAANSIQQRCAGLGKHAAGYRWEYA